MVAADIEVWSESPDPAGEAGIVVPAARCVAPYLRSFVPFTRPRARGRVIPVRVSEDTVSLTPVRADFLAQRLASSAGYELYGSPRTAAGCTIASGCSAASWMTVSPTSPPSGRSSARPSGALMGQRRVSPKTAPRTMGGWAAKMLGRRGFKDYPAQVIGTLAERGVLQPLACLKCPSCASTIRVTPSALGEPVRCELCSAPVSFGTYIANYPSRPATWAMKVMPALDEAHFNETLPVMAALSVFEAACGKGLTGSGMLYLPASN